MMTINQVQHLLDNELVKHRIVDFMMAKYHPTKQLSTIKHVFNVSICLLAFKQLHARSLSPTSWCHFGGSPAGTHFQMSTRYNRRTFWH